MEDTLQNGKILKFEIKYAKITVWHYHDIRVFGLSGVASCLSQQQWIFECLMIVAMFGH